MSKPTVPGSSRRARPSSWQRRIRYIYLRFIRQRDSAGAIARGLATGVFAGCFPLFGLQTIIGVALAIPFNGNKLMAAAGTWVSNPFTYIPIYFFNFRVGQQLLAPLGIQVELPEMAVLQGLLTEAGWAAAKDFMALGGQVSAALFLGCFVVGLGAAVLAYGIGLWLFHRLRYRPQSSS